jgi:protein NEDD1
LNAKQPTRKSSTDTNGVHRSAQTSKPAAKVVSSPAHARIARAGSGGSPARRLPSSLKEGAPAPSPKRTAATAPETKRKVFSPVRDPLGNSGNAGDISGM